MNTTQTTGLLRVILVFAIMTMQNRRSIRLRVEVDVADDRRLMFFWAENVLTRARTVQLRSPLGLQSQAYTFSNNNSHKYFTINFSVFIYRMSSDFLFEHHTHLLDAYFNLLKEPDTKYTKCCSQKSKCQSMSQAS